jgi:RNA polymerase sigma-70 factor (ECF subfamily)
MDPVPSFADWMARVRAGDASAAAELVRLNERAIRVAVRVRVTDPRLRRQFDSMDVCQSVLASFFVRAAAGQYDLSTPEQLVGLLVRMAQNKCLALARRHTQQKRDVRRVAGAGAKDPAVADAGPGPLQEAVARDLLSALLRRLGPDERELARRRALGEEWVDIARDLGGTPQGHRMRLSRAIKRISPELGLDDGDELDDRP